MPAPVDILRQGDGDFERVMPFKTGVVKYRFAAVSREAMQMHAAPFTRLGWEDARSEPNRLVTWPLKIEVADLGKRTAKAEAALVEHGRRVLGEVEKGAKKVEGGTEKVEAGTTTKEVEGELGRHLPRTCGRSRR